MGKIPEFNDPIMKVGNAFLVDEKHFIGMVRENRNLKDRIAELEAQIDSPRTEPIHTKKTGTVSGLGGRKPVLTEGEKSQVKKLYSGGHSLRDLASAFNVSHETIRQVVLESESVEKFCPNCGKETAWTREKKGAVLFCSECGVNENKYLDNSEPSEQNPKNGKSDIFGGISSKASDIDSI